MIKARNLVPFLVVLLVFPTAIGLSGCGEMQKPEKRSSLAAGAVVAGLFAYAIKESPPAALVVSASTSTTTSTSLGTSTTTSGGTTTTVSGGGAGDGSGGIGGDGAVWAKAASGQFSGREGHGLVSFSGQLFLIAGYGGANYLNDVWHSGDGVTWTLSTAEAGFSKRYGAACAAFDGGLGQRLWLIGGVAGATYNNEIWNSSDGAAWALVGRAAFSSREAAVILKYNNKLWIIGGLAAGGGYRNDVWSSADGVTWTQATAEANFSPRYRHAGAVFHNQMWITGGYDGANTLNDAWSSTDGINWSKAVGTMFSTREGHCAVVYSGRIWVIGGQNRATVYNSVWSSVDGSDWVLVAGNATYSPRYRHAGELFNGKIWLTGGTDSTLYRDDAWSVQ